MKIGVDDLKELLGRVENIEELDEIESLLKEFKPTIKRMIDLLLMYGPELREVIGALAVGISKIKMDQIKLFEDAGFIREEAILLVQDEWYALKHNLSNRKK